LFLHLWSLSRSAGQSFCDGSHKGTDFKPQPFTEQEDGDAYLCACKHSANTPFCDGSHKQFSSDNIGKEGPGLATDASKVPPATPTPEEPTVAFIPQLLEATGGVPIGFKLSANHIE
jgi:CDGSH-type Zn-finger protein